MMLTRAFVRQSILTLLALVAVACSSSGASSGASSSRRDDPAAEEVETAEPVGTFTRVKQWKDLVYVGVPAPSFTAFSEKSRQYLTQRDPPGKFFVYFHHSDMPPVCLDKDCGDIAKTVNAKGGRFMGFSDPKAVESLGILKRDRQGFEVSPSLVVVADQKAIVKAIFVHAGPNDLARVLQEAGY